MNIQHKYAIALTFLCCCCTSSLLAQMGKVPVQNHRDNGINDAAYTINIKWYTQDLLYEQGVNIYRKKTNQDDWIKINEVPITKKDDVPSASYIQDDNLEAFVTLINGAKPSELQGLFLLNVLFKSFESDVYARFLGIQYDDSRVKRGHTYQYKVMKVVRDGEQLIGVSDTITAGKFEPIAPVQNVEIATKKRKIELNWLPEEDRFYAVNIYQGSTTTSQLVKINEQPVVISMSPDSSGEAVYPEVMYVDDSLQENTSYRYSLTGLDFFGNETRASPEVAVTLKDISPPAPPVGLKEKIQNPEVILYWQSPATEDLQGFNVYRSRKSEGPYQQVNSQTLSSSVTSYTDKAPSSGAYYYYVSSVDEAENEAPSEKVFAEIHDITAPSPPQNLSIVADTGRLTLTWQMNPEADLLGYLLFRTVTTNDPNQFVLLNAEPLLDTKFVEALPKNAKNSFLYKIVAVDSAYNRSAFSKIAVARMPDVTPPARPVIKSVALEEENLIITWENNIEEDILGYRVYRTEDSATAKYEQINTDLLPARTYRYTDRSTTPGIDYYYTLVALDSNNNESTRSKVYPVKGRTVPSKLVTFKNAKASFDKKGRKVDLSWKVNESEGLIGYVVYKRAGDQGKLSPATGLLRTAAFGDKKVSDNTQYHYEIRAYTDSGEVVKSKSLSLSINN